MEMIDFFREFIAVRNPLKSNLNELYLIECGPGRPYAPAETSYNTTVPFIPDTWSDRGLPVGRIEN